MTVPKPKPSPRRRGARPLFFCALLMLAAGCGKGDGLSDYEREQQKKDNAASAIQSAGGTVTSKHYDFGPGRSGDGHIIDLHGAQISDAIFDNMKIMGHAAELDLRDSNVTDEQMARLNELGVGNLLIRLDLSSTAISDAGLDKLTDLYCLMNLNLTGTRATADGVQRFLAQRRNNPKTVFKATKVQTK